MRAGSADAPLILRTVESFQPLLFCLLDSFDSHLEQKYHKYLHADVVKDDTVLTFACFKSKCVLKLKSAPSSHLLEDFFVFAPRWTKENRAFSRPLLG